MFEPALLIREKSGQVKLSKVNTYAVCIPDCTCSAFVQGICIATKPHRVAQMFVEIRHPHGNNYMSRL